MKRPEHKTGKEAPAAKTSTPKPPRRRQEDRTRLAKDKLLRATIEVLVRDGYGGLTMKEVAKQAQLSSGALMHHYTNKGELIVAATAMIYDEAIVRGQRLANTEGAVKKPVEGFISDCLSVYFEWPFLAAIETIVVARTDPELMQRILPVMEHYRVTCNEIWLAVFKRAGIPRKKALLLLNLSLNIVRGMAINRLWRHDEAYYKAYLKEWTRVAYAQLEAALPATGRKRTRAT